MLNRRTVISSGISALVLAGPAWSQDAAAVPEITDMTMGNPDAAVTLIEYASFTCPHCKRFHEDVMPRLKADYVDAGKVNFVYREVFFDRPGLWAAMVARCGGEMRYFAITDMIYAKQSEWLRAGSPAGIADGLRKIGLAAGIGQEELDACLSDGAMAQAMVANYEKNMAEYAISGTPSLVVNGKILGNMSYDRLQEEIDSRLYSIAPEFW